jgi:DNA end-binding protein Ku
MPRPSWRGYLKLSLVSCAVALYNASSSSERVSFNTLNRKTGNRLKQNLVDSVSGEAVDTADRVKGYQVAKGQYVMVEDTDLEALKIESTKTIEIETFVPQAEVDQIYVDSPYYLAPDDKVAEEAFAVIREAMTRKKMVGIGRVVLSRRERMLMLQPREKGMLATTLRYPYEVRQDAEYFGTISERKLPAEMVDIAQEIIGRMAGHFEPDTFKDRYEEAVVAMLQAKQAGQSFSVPEAPSPGNVVDIMEALRRSLQASGADGTALRRPRAPSKKPAEAPAETEADRKPAARKAATRATTPHAGTPHAATSRAATSGAATSRRAAR